MSGETALVKACVDYLTMHGCFVWRVNVGAMTSTSTDKGGRIKRRFIRFNKPGVSDIIGLVPCGRFIAIEVKRKPNKPTQMQIDFINAVIEHGGIGAFIYSIEELEQLWGEISGEKDTTHSGNVCGY